MILKQWFILSTYDLWISLLSSVQLFDKKYSTWGPISTAVGLVAFVSFFSMSTTGVQSLALALAENPETFQEKPGNRRKGKEVAMARRKPLLKCACDLRYCKQNFCMTEGVCFASARRKHRKKGKF